MYIGTTYEVRGMVEKTTSYATGGGAGTPVNEMKNTYNDFGLLTSQEQSHAGATNGSKPTVEYSYAPGSSDGGATGNTVRPMKLTYPNSRELNYVYPTGADDKLSRLSQYKDNDGTTVLVDYTYLGLGGFVKIDFQEPSVQYDLATGNGVNPYAGLDRFGRIIDLKWAKQSGMTTNLVRLKYGYDRSSNRVHREDVIGELCEQPLDELYQYDSLNQIRKIAPRRPDRCEHGHR